MSAREQASRPRRSPRFRRTTAFLGSIALAVVSVILVLVAFEVGFRVAGYEPIYEVYSKPSLFWERDELLGWSHTPGARGTYVGPRPWPIEFEAPIHINSLGLRGPEPTSLPPDGYRVMILGDSMVASFEVPYEESFPALVEAQLNEEFAFPVQVINAGVRAYGTDQSYLYYLERGSLLAPDLVLFVHSNNDARNNMTLHRMRRPFGKAAFALEADDALRLVGTPIPEFPLCSAYQLNGSFEPTRVDRASTRLLCRLQLRVFDHSALFTAMALRLRRNPGLLGALYELGAPPRTAVAASSPGFRLTSVLIRRLAAAVREGGARFAVLIPERQLELLDTASFEADGIEFHSIPAGVEPGVDPISVHFKSDSHWNAKGHRLVARLLEPIVSRHVAAARPAPALSRLAGQP